MDAAANDVHVHRWNFADRCCDPACPAERCGYLARTRHGARRTSWYRCSRSAAPGGSRCEQHRVAVREQAS
jgi:hypothetical protein